MTSYTPAARLKTQFLDIQGLRYAVHTWGEETSVPVVLLHGWADTGRSFQFLADAMADSCYLIAPDWRGFGDSGWSPGGYWFPDYLADLDALLEQFSPGAPVCLVGHSMGGNAACLYAGIRPARVSHLVSLDVFGLADSDPAQAPARYGQWLQQIREGTAFTEFAGLEQLRDRVGQLVEGIADDRAAYIARTWSRPADAGSGYLLKADPRHKRVNPVLYRRAEARACWRSITAETLFVHGGNSELYQRYLEQPDREESIACFTSYRETVIEGAGHMLHLQCPDQLAAILVDFFPSIAGAGVSQAG